MSGSASSAPSSSPAGGASPAPGFRFPVRVYWEDTDAGGVVFYANYLKFFERARTEWLRAAGCEQSELRERTGAIFIVTDTSVRYFRPARLDDLLEITVEVVHAGPVRIALAQQAWRGADLLAESTIRIGCIDAGTFRPRRIPIPLPGAGPQADGRPTD